MFYVTVGFVSDQVVVRLETNPIFFFSFSLLPFRNRVAKVINHISGKFSQRHKANFSFEIFNLNKLFELFKTKEFDQPSLEFILQLYNSVQCSIDNSIIFKLFKFLTFRSQIPCQIFIFQYPVRHANLNMHVDMTS